MKNHFPTFTKWFNRIKQRVQNRFEAAVTQWGARRWLLTTYQDARFEVDFAQSMEICRKHLDFVENCPLVQRIRNLKIQFAVGVDGLMVVPSATDPKMEKVTLADYNDAKARRWAAFCKSPDLGSNLSMGELTIQWEGMLFDVGNVIVLKTMDEKGQPKIQTIDRLRLQTPPQFASEEGKTVCQGIRLKKMLLPVTEISGGKRSKVLKEIITGKPELYYIRDEFDQNKFAEVPAENVIHKFRALRPGMMVGIPEAFSVINLLTDFTDLHILEMGASKLAAKIATVETNPSGELDPQFMRQTRLGIGTVNPNGNPATKTVQADYEVTLGGEKIALKSGDKLENFMVNRPTVAQQDYWDFLLSQICIGYNTPKLLVVPYSLQGTVTRADLDICSTAFRADFELIAAVLRDIYEWWSAIDNKHNRENYGKTIPQNPHDCIIRPPRAPNVDIGYTASALALELEMGVKTYQDVCAEQNKNWRNELREIAETERYIDELAEEYQIAPERIAFKLFKSGASMTANDAGETDDEDDGTEDDDKKTTEETKKTAAHFP